MMAGCLVRWKALVGICVLAGLAAGCPGEKGPYDCPQTSCSEEGTSCDGNTLVECTTDAKACLQEQRTSCAGACVEPVPDNAMCTCDDPLCAGANDGATSCDGDTLVTCTDDGNGCLKATTDDCTTNGEVCDDSSMPAVCVPPAGCTDNPACAGMSDGDTSCSGGLVNQCNLGADDCLDLTQESCGAALCDDSSGTPTCGTVTQSGEDCANAIPVLSSTFSLSGEDFAADFADDVTVTGSSCNTGAGNDVADAVLSVALSVGDTVAVTESGGLSSVINVQSGTCGGTESCVASANDPNVDPFTFTAGTAGTYYILVESYGTGYNGSYDIEVSVDPECGNGLVEAGEMCDDGNTTDNDGCTDCIIDFAFDCDGQSPTTCDPAKDLGVVTVGTDLVDRSLDILPANDVDFYSFMLAEPAQVTVTTAANDPQDMGSVNSFLQAVVDGIIDSDFGSDLSTSIGPDTLRPGDYVIQVAAGTALDHGYNLTLSSVPIPAVGAGDTINESGGAIAQFSGDYYSFTVTDAVLVTGTLTTGGGDADFDVRYQYRYFTEHNDQGDESIDSVLLPGTYLFEVTAYTKVTSYNLDLSLATANPTDIGTFAAGDTIPATNGGPLTARDYDHYTITFSEDVLLDATLAGNSTGDTGLCIYDADSRPVYSFAPGDETVTDQPLAAGTYVVQIRTKSAAFGGGDVDAYTLTLVTTAAP